MRDVYCPLEEILTMSYLPVSSNEPESLAVSSPSGVDANNSKLQLPHLQPKMVVKQIRIKIITISRGLDFLSAFINLLIYIKYRYR